MNDIQIKGEFLLERTCPRKAGTAGMLTLTEWLEKDSFVKSVQLLLSQKL